MKGFCPACQKEVEYEYIDGDFFCPDCGRNKEAAEKAYKIIKKVDKKERMGILWQRFSIWVYAILIVPLAILVWLFRHHRAAQETFYKFALPLLLFLCVGLYYDFKKSHDAKKKKGTL
jgi:glucan phosphoethanolaminetransferase (alkaline phosphatase superfamily)